MYVSTQSTIKMKTFVKKFILLFCLRFYHENISKSVEYYKNNKTIKSCSNDINDIDINVSLFLSSVFFICFVPITRCTYGCSMFMANVLRTGIAFCFCFTVFFLRAIAAPGFNCSSFFRTLSLSFPW